MRRTCFASTHPGATKAKKKDMNLLSTTLVYDMESGMADFQQLSNSIVALLQSDCPIAKSNADPRHKCQEDNNMAELAYYEILNHYNTRFEQYIHQFQSICFKIVTQSLSKSLGKPKTNSKNNGKQEIDDDDDSDSGSTSIDNNNYNNNSNNNFHDTKILVHNTIFEFIRSFRKFHNELQHDLSFWNIPSSPSMLCSF